MNKVIEIVNQLRNTPGTNDKIAILKKNKEDDLLKMVLKYTYDPYMKYRMSEKTIKPIENDFESAVTIFEILGKLERNNINDNLRYMVNAYLGGIPNVEKRDLYTCMILKDLKIGCNAKTINKVWEDLIPSFSVMLAESYFKNQDTVKGEFVLTTKLDGHRLVGIKENNKVKFYTRAGHLMEGLVEIAEDFAAVPNGVVLDGEILLRNDNNLPSDELFRETGKVVKKDGIKKNLEFHVFDYVSLQGFEKGIDKTQYIERKELLHYLITNNNFKTIKEVEPLYIGKDKDKIIELLNEAKDNNLEGVMVNTSSGEYQCKRSKEILKVKVMSTMDLKVIGFEEGSGNFKGTLGAMTVEYKGNSVGVGSGFSLIDREEIWNNQDKYIGKIAEIQYFEISKDSKTGLESLRFPVYKTWRFDKSEPSYN